MKIIFTRMPDAVGTVGGRTIQRNDIAIITNKKAGC